MNRRGFLGAMLQAGVAFTILPPASTYARVWRVARVVPAPPGETFMSMGKAVGQLSAEEFRRWFARLVDEPNQEASSLACTIDSLKNFYREDLGQRVHILFTPADATCLF